MPSESLAVDHLIDCQRRDGFLHRPIGLCDTRRKLRRTMALQRLALHPAVQISVAAWIAAYGLVLLLAGGHFPFDRPALAGIPFALQLAAPTIGMIQIFLLLAIIYWLTRKRVSPDIAARAPARAIAARETAALLAYAAAGQVGGAGSSGRRSAIAPSASISPGPFTAARRPPFRENSSLGRSTISWFSRSFPTSGFVAATIRRSSICAPQTGETIGW
jgi:hypothetical protein